MSGFGFPASMLAQTAEALRAQGVVDDAQHDRLVAAAQVPWWLMLLQTLAAWVASLLILSSFMLPLSLLVDHALVRALAGVALCAVAVVLFRRERLFTAQMALAFSLAGQALVVSACCTRRTPGMGFAARCRSSISPEPSGEQSSTTMTS